MRPFAIVCCFFVHRFVSAQSFMDLLSLLVSNCFKYCASRFPSLPPLADGLYKHAFEELREVCLGDEVDTTRASSDSVVNVWRHMLGVLPVSSITDSQFGQ